MPTEPSDSMRWWPEFMPEGKRGHKYFFDTDGGPDLVEPAMRWRVAVADDSGAFPDRTDDGILYLDRSREIVPDGDQEVYEVSGICRIPLLRPDGRETYLMAGTSAAIAVADRFRMRLSGRIRRSIMARPLPTLSFLGHSTCGKDEAGLWLRAHTPLRFEHTTSWYLAPFAAEEHGIPLEVLRGPGRHEHKELMFKTGRRLRATNPGILIRLALGENDVVSGVRDPEEVDYLREHKVVDLIVWLDRDVPEDPTMRRFGPAPWCHADVRLDNTGDLPAFHARLARLARALGIPVKHD